jgi:hypothetical protein
MWTSSNRWYVCLCCMFWSICWLMYVYYCAEENNFLNCCSITYFVSGDRWIYVRLFIVVYHSWGHFRHSCTEAKESVLQRRVPGRQSRGFAYIYVLFFFFSVVILNWYLSLKLNLLWTFSSIYAQRNSILPQGVF